jgi:aminoglycoside/choline kinase family phosphotransferase
MSPLAEPAAQAARVTWREPAREAAFHHWLAAIAPRFGLDASTLAPASADASFRRYLRLQGREGSLVVMDAPPPLEDVRPFVHVAGLLAEAGVNAPRVLAADEAAGFLLLTDMGTELYLDAMRAAGPAEADRLMREALTALVHWQQHVRADTLPAFDAARIHEELALFPTWCVQREHGIVWSPQQQAAWQQVCERIVASALAQPAVAVHADFMPRNLMRTPEHGSKGPGILDFQDAVRGAITYDLASLLRDAFVSWPEEQQLDWAVRWWQQARKAGLPVDGDFGEFWRALEWMGLQRHLRILGVFCRLKHRDNKPRYAEDLPRFFGYATKVAMRYRPLAPLLPLLEPMSGAAVEAGFTF